MIDPPPKASRLDRFLWTLVLVAGLSSAAMAFAFTGGADLPRRLEAAATYFVIAIAMCGGLVALARWAMKR